MHIVSIAALLALTVLAPAIAFAEGGGVVKPPAIGTGAPTPPTAGGEAVPPPIDQPTAPSAPNTALGTSRDAPKAPLASTGVDTSTAGPGGQAESTKNGALSSPPSADGDKVQKHPKTHKTGVSPEADSKR
jgi:hypothetical protein